MQFISQNSFHALKDSELLKLTLNAAKTEKEATLALLDYLIEIDTRRLYATVNACSSLFDYLVKELGFSHPAAAERVNTVRLIRAVPPVKQHLETGKLTLTSAAQIQRFVHAEQKVDPRRRAVSTEEKTKVVEACLGKSKREVEKTLFEKLSEPARILTQEKVRAITSSRSEIKFTVSDDTLEKLKQLKDLVGDQSLEKIFDQALDSLLVSEKKKRGVTPKQSAVSTKKNKPPKKSTPKMKTENHAARSRPADQVTAKTDSVIFADQFTPDRPDQTITAKTEISPSLKLKLILALKPTLSTRFIPIGLKRFVFARSKGKCEFVDPRTKTRCESTFRLQIDHVIPLALGGETKTSNLRHLCSAHNLRMATQAGLTRPNKMEKYS